MIYYARRVCEHTQKMSVSAQPSSAVPVQHFVLMSAVTCELMNSDPRSVSRKRAPLATCAASAAIMAFTYSKAVVCGVPASLPAAALRMCDSGEPVNLQKAREQHEKYVQVTIRKLLPSSWATVSQATPFVESVACETTKMGYAVTKGT